MPKIKMSKIGRRELKAAQKKAGGTANLMAILGKHRNCYYGYRAACKAPVDVVEQIRAYLGGVEGGNGSEIDGSGVGGSETKEVVDVNSMAQDTASTAS